MQRVARHIPGPLLSEFRRRQAEAARPRLGLKLPREVLRWEDKHLVLEDLAPLQGFAVKHARHLLKLRRSAPELRELTPVALALLAIHVEAGAVEGEEGAPGIQSPGYGWSEVTGYTSRSSVLDGFALLTRLGLARRYEQLRTVESLTASLPEGQRLTEWTDKDGKQGRKWANVWSISYATPAGRDLLERLGWVERATEGTLGRVRVGFLGWLSRLARPLRRALAERQAGAPKKNRTPHAVTDGLLDTRQREDGHPSYPQAGALRLRTEAGCEVRSPGGAREVADVESAQEAPHALRDGGVRGAGRGDGLTRQQAQNVAHCLSRSVWEPVYVRVPAPCRCSPFSRQARRWEGFGPHLGWRCPHTAGNEHMERWHWRRVGWRRVARPVLTAAELWPAAWARAGAEERERLVELARPVLLEAWRQLEAQRLARAALEERAREVALTRPVLFELWRHLEARLAVRAPMGDAPAQGWLF